MNRIEYLINNPNEIDVIDLDLLNNEIEKYPYFYSLRALKLLALKKSDHQDFEKQLEIISSFNNTKNLFNLLSPSTNQESISQEVDIIEESNEEIEVESLVETQEVIYNQENLIEEEIIVEQENEVIIEAENLIEQNNIDDIAIEESIEKSIEITKDFLKTDEIIIAAVEQTIDVLQETEKSEEINQVEIEKEFIKSEILSISNSTPFQILNIKNEIVRNRETKNNEISIQKNIEEVIEESKPEEEKINNEATFKEIEKVIDEPKVIAEQNQIIEEKVIESKPIEEIKEEVTLKTEETNSYSFNEWLQQPTSNSSDSQKELKYQVIEDFLEKNPKLTQLKKQEIPEYKNEVKDLKQTDFSDLMTETLAQIYIEQKQYEKAIRAYKILILKYPEKNSLFANQIKEIDNLKNSK